MFNFNKRAIQGLATTFFAAVFALTATVSAFAWGPERETFTTENPADFVTFNSITDNPHIGDERNFVGARRRGSTDLWSSDLTISRGNEYVIRMYIHNNAADGLALVAEDVRASINVPDGRGRKVAISGVLDSSNAIPSQIWDQVRLHADEDFRLEIVPGSARFSNNTWLWPNDIGISDSLFTEEGVLLGFDALDGRIPGCFRYAGYLTFIVRPQFSDTALSRFENLVTVAVIVLSVGVGGFLGFNLKKIQTSRQERRNAS